MKRYCKAVMLMWAAGLACGQPAADPKNMAQLRLQNLKTAYAALPDNQKAAPCGPIKAAPTADARATYCRALQAEMSPGERRIEFAAILNVDTTTAAKQAFSSALAAYANARLDVQNSSQTNSPGATSVAERAGFSSVLGAALDAGAVTQSVNGSTLTLQANALSLARFLEGQKDIFQYCLDGTLGCNGQNGWAPFLNTISGSAALSVSNSSQAVSGMVTGASGATGGTGAMTPSATALIQNSSSRLTSFTVKTQIYNKMDLHSASYLKNWSTAFHAAIPGAAALVTANDAAFPWLQNAAYNAWFVAAEPVVKAEIAKVSDPLSGMDIAGGSDELETTVATQWAHLVTAEGDNISKDAFAQLYEAAGVYLNARDAANNSIRQQFADGLSLTYTFSQPQSQPKISTLKLIYTLHPSGSGAGKGSATAKGSAAAPTPAPGAAASATPPGPVTATRHDYSLSFNLAADLYNSPPAGTNTLKDLQAALQADYHFGTSTTSAVGTLAGYYQYQSSASAITIGSGNLAPGTNITLPGTAATLLAPKGHIWVVEALVTFPMKAGTNIPVGVTWSNRTELINAPEVRGHIGFNFDWSSLFAGSQTAK